MCFVLKFVLVGICLIVFGVKQKDVSSLPTVLSVAIKGLQQTGGFSGQFKCVVGFVWFRESTELY
jgi:hypothetical protein